jgi:hypothetical protein
LSSFRSRRRPGSDNPNPAPAFAVSNKHELLSSIMGDRDLLAACLKPSGI